jgi:TPP-dependent pyruvate/acetoin dehydrogenase alpha subunit
MDTKQFDVEVTVGSGKDKKTFRRPSESNLWQDRNDILTNIEDDKKLAATLKLINEAEEARVRKDVRAEILKNEAAVAATEEKSVKEFFNMRKNAGEPVTMDEARQIMEFMRTVKAGDLKKSAQA